jgi:LytS/YehU family sensor histidine kinase
MRFGVSKVTVDLSISRRSDSLTVWITNTCPPITNAAHSMLDGGLGLENVRERLNILYGSRAVLVAAQPAPSRFEVRISIPYREFVALAAN